MLSLKPVAFFVCAILAGAVGAKFVDTISKCSIYDNDCQAALVTSTLKAIAKTGIPEVGIPPVDPLSFGNITVSLLNLIDLTAVEGIVKGLKDCTVKSYNTVIKEGHTEMKIECSVTLKVKYSINGSNPLLVNLLGGESVHGEGRAKVKIEKILLTINYIYDLARNSDGDTFFNWRFNKTFWDFDLKGKINFDADKIFLGKTDATQLVLGVINENANVLTLTLGKPVVEKAMEIADEYTHRFFTSIPAKYLITEDLSEFIKN